MNGLVEPNLKGSRIPFLFGGGNGPLVEQREPLDAEGFRTADRPLPNSNGHFAPVYI